MRREPCWREKHRCGQTDLQRCMHVTLMHLGLHPRLWAHKSFPLDKYILTCMPLLCSPATTDLSHAWSLVWVARQSASTHDLGAPETRSQETGVCSWLCACAGHVVHGASIRPQPWWVICMWHEDVPHHAGTSRRDQHAGQSRIAGAKTPNACLIHAHAVYKVMHRGP